MSLRDRLAGFFGAAPVIAMVSVDNLAPALHYFKRLNLIHFGGSWKVSRTMIAANNWAAITDAARQATGLNIYQQDNFR